MGEDKSSFEEQWNDAFNEAEVTPPAHVWTAIDGHLANQQAGSYRRAALFYKWIAAACLILFSSYGVYFWQSQQLSQEALSSAYFSSPIMNIDHEVEECDYPVLAEAGEKSAMTKTSIPSDKQSAALGIVDPEKKEPLISHPRSVVKSLKRSLISPHSLTSLAAKGIPKSSLMKSLVIDHLYGTPRVWEVMEEEKKSASLWAGVSFASGSFNPGFSNTESLNATVAEPIISEFVEPVNYSTISSPSYSSGQSISGGLNIGTQFDSRLVLSGGIHYNAFNTGSSASPVYSSNDGNYALTPEISDPAFSEVQNHGSLERQSEDVLLINEYQYLSIPLKAGYMIIDKKINITLNTGLSSNILMNANLAPVDEQTPLSNDFETTGSYERIYFNGLASLSFGMLFKEKYQVSVEPSYTHALTKFTRANNVNQGKPRDVGLSIGLSYHF